MSEGSGMTAVEAMQREQTLTPQEVARRRKEFYQVIEPIRKSMAALAVIQPFELTIIGGEIRREIMWEPRAKASYDQGQAMIAYWAEQILERGR